MRLSRFLGLILLAAISFTSYADNTAEFGDYIVNYNALPTDALLPEVARAYKIKRSNNRGMLNIVIQRKTSNGAKGVKAKVTGTGSNLNGQLKHLVFREIGEEGVTYYISEFRVTNKEMIAFKINVQPEGSSTSHIVEFKKEFYTD